MVDIGLEEYGLFEMIKRCNSIAVQGKEKRKVIIASGQDLNTPLNTSFPRLAVRRGTVTEHRRSPAV